MSDRDRDGLLGQVASILSEYTFVSEKDGKLIESRRYYLQTVIYNLTGKKAFETTLEACDACSIVKTKYDEKGKAVEEAHYNPINNSLTMRIIYNYDSSGKPVGEDYYDATGKPYRKWKYTYEYDPEGNWIKKTASMYDPKFFDGKDGFIVRQITYRAIAYH